MNFFSSRNDDENADGSLISDEEYKEQKATLLKNISRFEEQLNDKKVEQLNWLERCERFFVNIRQLAREYEGKKDVWGKRILLQAVGAKFVRKDEEWLVELQKPFSMVLTVEKQEIPDELGLSQIHKPKFNMSAVEMYKWQGRQESNPH